MHDHAGQAASTRRSNRWRLQVVLCLCAAYWVVEVSGAFLTGSLALLADAGHTLSDLAALGLSLFAIWIAERPPTARRTYGHTRAEILAALANGAALMAVALFIIVEAVERLAEPPEVKGLGMIAVASGALCVNLIGLFILHGGRANLNVRGAWLHVLNDALGSLGAIGAGLAIWSLGWRWADPAASLLISALVLYSAWHLLREAVDVLMETAPRHLDVDEIRDALARVPSVLGVHDLHVWSIGSGEVSLSSHVVTHPSAQGSELLGGIYDLLGSRFGIDHATIQIEHESFASESPQTRCSGACEPVVQ